MLKILRARTKAHTVCIYTTSHCLSMQYMLIRYYNKESRIMHQVRTIAISVLQLKLCSSTSAAPALQLQKRRIRTYACNKTGGVQCGVPRSRSHVIIRSKHQFCTYVSSVSARNIMVGCNCMTTSCTLSYDHDAK